MRVLLSAVYLPRWAGILVPARGQGANRLLGVVRRLAAVFPQCPCGIRAVGDVRTAHGGLPSPMTHATPAGFQFPCPSRPAKLLCNSRVDLSHQFHAANIV